jgi:hypothetical protein
VSQKNIVKAVDSFLVPLQQSLSCFTKQVLKVKNKYSPVHVQTASLPNLELEIMTRFEEVMTMSVAHYYRIVLGENTLPKVRSVGYEYILGDHKGREILGFHWHPESPNGPLHFPHMHIGEAAGAPIRNEFHAFHIPTPRMGFEDFALILLDDFAILPERPDAADVLRANLERFRQVRSWDTIPR